MNKLCGECRFFNGDGQGHCTAVEGIRPMPGPFETCCHKPSRWEPRADPVGGRLFSDPGPFKGYDKRRSRKWASTKEGRH